MDLLEYLQLRGCSPLIVDILVSVDSFLLSLPGVVREFSSPRNGIVVPRDVHYKKGDSDAFVLFLPWKSSFRVNSYVAIDDLDGFLVSRLGIVDDSSSFGNRPHITFSFGLESDVDSLLRLLRLLYGRVRI